MNIKACATAGGGVMFIPDEIERKGAAISYADLVKKEKKSKIAPLKAFGKRKKAEKQDRVAAA